jgi:hypothetical protein
MCTTSMPTIKPAPLPPPPLMSESDLPALQIGTKRKSAGPSKSLADLFVGLNTGAGSNQQGVNIP